MDPFVALLLLPPVIAASVAGYAALKRRWAVHEWELRTATAETESHAARRDMIAASSMLKTRLDDLDAVRSGLSSLEQQVASLKNQFSLSSTARR